MGGTTAKSCLIEPRRARADQHVRGRPHLPLQEGLGLPGVGARRSTSSRSAPAAAALARLDDLGLLKVGPESGRRRPRPGLLRPRRHASRPSPTPIVRARPARPRLLPRRRHAARPRRRRRRAARRGRSARPRRRGDTAGRHPRARQPEHGGRLAHARASSRATTCAASPCSPSAAPARCTPAAWPSCSSQPAWCSPPTPACFGVRHARHRRCASTSPARCVRPLGDRWTRAERDGLLDELRAEGRRVLARRRRRADDDVRFRYGLDARYLGQGNEITVWVGEGATWPGDRRRGAPSFETEYRRIYGLTIPDVGDRGRHVAPSALGHDRHRRAACRRRQRAHDAGRDTHRPVALQPRQPPRSTRRCTGATTLGAGATVRRPGHRRRARDHRGHPAGLDRRPSAADGRLIATRNASDEGVHMSDRFDPDRARGPAGRA